MKKQKNVLVLVVLILMSFNFSCGDSTSSSGNIIGEWTIVKAEGMSAAMNQGMVYKFNEDGTALVGSGEYTYTLNNDTLLMNFNGANDIILKWKYNINGDKMTMENLSDASQKFELEK